MGFSGISIWQIGVIVVLIILLFGTKRLKNIGGDIGNGIKALRKSLQSEDNKDSKSTDEEQKTK